MKASHAPKKDAHAQDWHPADVVAALKKRRLSLRALSIQHGYSPTTLGNALRIAWPKAEQIIAEAIGERPENIWPTRYAWRHCKPQTVCEVTA